MVDCVATERGEVADCRQGATMGFGAVAGLHTVAFPYEVTPREKVVGGEAEEVDDPITAAGPVIDRYRLAFVEVAVVVVARDSLDSPVAGGVYLAESHACSLPRATVRSSAVWTGAGD